MKLLSLRNKIINFLNVFKQESMYRMKISLFNPMNFCNSEILLKKISKIIIKIVKTLMLIIIIYDLLFILTNFLFD